MIRLTTAADAAAIAAIYAPYVEASEISFETIAPSAAEMADRIKKTAETFPWLVEDDGGVAGYAYASRHRDRAAYRWSVDVAAYVAPHAKRRGVGRRLYAALFELLLRQGFVNAYAGITLPNVASVGLHEAMGFSRIGTYTNVGYKQGAWRTVGWWEKRLLPDPPHEPADPVPLPQLLAAEPSLLPR